MRLVYLLQLRSKGASRNISTSKSLNISTSLNVSTSKMSNSTNKKIIFKTGSNSSLFIPSATSVAFALNGYEDRQLNFAESFSTQSNQGGGSIIEEGEENDSELSDQILRDLKSIIDDVIGLQLKPAVCTLTVERKVRRVCDLYSDLPTKYRNSALRHLSENHDVDVETILTQAKDIVCKIENNSNYVPHFEEMRSALTPPYVWLFTKIGQLEGGVKFLVDMRAATIDFARTVDPNDAMCRSGMREMTSHLRSLLANWFSVGFMAIEQVTWSSPCSMLQKVSDYEAVHPMRNWTDLKARVGPYRRCFVYTHRSMPGEPIVVLHVALTTEISNNIGSLVKHHRKISKSTSLEVESSASFSALEPNKNEDPSLCKTAIFYSITSTQTGLQGIELGTFLIKQAVQRLKDEFPEMNQFSTLSPIPGFRAWILAMLQATKKGDCKIFTTSEFSELEEYLAKCFSKVGSSKGIENVKIESDPTEQLIELIKTNGWVADETLVALLEKPLLRLCAQYLFLEKRRKGALDSVANFHLRNGATLWRINWLADLSPRGLSNSCGMMVNYRYFIENLEKNSSNYLEEHVVEASEQVLQLVSQAQKVRESD